MGDAKLSTNKSTYYPPSLMPGYMGLFIPVKHGHGYAEKGNVNYFQEQSSETMSMPSSDCGQQRAPYTPRPDIIAANKIVNMERMLRSPFLPLTQIDSTRRNEIDDFYMAAQKHRDQYRDHSGRLHPLKYFQESEYRWQCPSSLTRTYLRFPQYYTAYRKPPMLANNLGRTTSFPPLPDRSLAGRYYKHNDISYKR